MQKPKLAVVPQPTETMSLSDGSMVVTLDQLERLGDGDVKRGRRYLRMLIADTREQPIFVGPVQKPENVLIAGPADEIGILTLLIEETSRFSSMNAPISPEQIMDQIQKGTRSMGGIVGIIRDPASNQIVAASVMFPAQPGHSKAWYLHEIFNAVHIDHRRNNYGRDLLQFGCWCADEWTTKFGYRIHYVAGVADPDRYMEKVRFYKRHMSQIGAMFIYPTP